MCNIIFHKTKLNYLPSITSIYFNFTNVKCKNIFIFLLEYVIKHTYFMIDAKIMCDKETINYVHVQMRDVISI